MQRNKRAIGRFYEEEALNFLQMNGYRFVDKNVWTAGGEIDLVMEKADRLYFVEVKYRSSEAYGNPRLSITRKKKSNMTKAALYYLKSGYKPYSIAFLGITKKEDTLDFDFIEDIFE